MREKPKLRRGQHSALAQQVGGLDARLWGQFKEQVGHNLGLGGVSSPAAERRVPLPGPVAPGLLQGDTSGWRLFTPRGDLFDALPATLPSMLIVSRDGRWPVRQGRGSRERKGGGRTGGRGQRRQRRAGGKNPRNAKKRRKKGGVVRQFLGGGRKNK